MKGLYARKSFDSQLQELTVRSLGPREVRLKVLACGVCGTDLHLLRQAEDYSPLGHEVCGQVLACGSEVKRFQVEQQVVMEDVALCGVCEACKSGRSDLCRSGHDMQGAPGMAEELVVHENMLHDATGIPPLAAAMTEPLAVSIRCVETLNPRPGKPLAIFGMGAIGLYCAAYARLRGAGRIVIIARDPKSARNRIAGEIAQAYGADDIVYTKEVDWQQRILAQGPVDAAIVAAPPPLCVPALDLVDYGGRVLACGITFGEDRQALLNINDMVFQKKSLLTSIAEPALGFPLSLQLIRTGRIDVQRIITHSLPLAQHERLKELYGQDAPAVKTVMLSA